jgi:FYVE/RhoGEF/PH domain-containing protein 5/6
LVNVNDMFKFVDHLVRQILNVNITLLDMIEKENEKWPYGNIPAQIVTTGPFLKLYTPYVQGFDQAISTLNAASSQNPALAQFLKKESRHIALKGLQLQSLLIMPVQRSK